MAKRRIASADSFRPREEEVQLPSQRGGDEWVRLRKANALDLMTEDGQVANLFNRAQEAGQEAVGFSVDDLRVLTPFLNRLMCAVMVDPPVQDTDTPDEGYVSASWLDINDKIFVLSWALGGEYVQAERFPQEQSTEPESVPEGGSVEQSPLIIDGTDG